MTRTSPDFFRIFIVLALVAVGAGCSRHSLPTRDHEIVAAGVAQKGGDVALSLKSVDAELALQAGEYDKAAPLIRECLRSNDESVRDGIYTLGNYYKTPERRAEWMSVLDRSKADSSAYIRSRYVYYLMLVPDSQWRSLAEKQRQSADALMRESAEAAIRVGTLREAKKKR